MRSVVLRGALRHSQGVWPLTELPPITRQYTRFAGEFVVSLTFVHLRAILDK
jgi:hypothetical protein